MDRDTLEAKRDSLRQELVALEQRRLRLQGALALIEDFLKDDDTAPPKPRLVKEAT